MGCVVPETILLLLGVEDRSKQWYGLAAGITGIIAASIFLYDVLSAFEYLEAFSNMTAPDLPDIPVSLTPFIIIIAQSALYIPVAALLGGAIFVYGRRQRQEKDPLHSIGTQILYMVHVFGAVLLPYIQGLVLYFVLSEIDAVAAPTIMTIYASITLWAVIGAASLTYYVRSTPLPSTSSD